MQKIGETSALQRIQNIILEGFDPVSAEGFTQIPNSLLNNKELSFAAKTVYSKLLSYAWYHDRVFPGQETMAEDIGSTTSTINRAIKELKEKGWLEINRRGLGKTNIYTLKYVIKPRK